jgi:hypothetical protein
MDLRSSPVKPPQQVLLILGFGLQGPHHCGSQKQLTSVSVSPEKKFFSFLFFFLSFFFFFLLYWGLNSGPTPLATPPALFCDFFFQDRVLKN